MLNAETLSSADFAFRAAAYDVESGLEEVQIRLNGAVVSMKHEDDITEADIGGISFMPEAPLTDGAHLITVYARDVAGNENAVNSSFTVDTATMQPVLDLITSPLNSPLIRVEGGDRPCR